MNYIIRTTKTPFLDLLAIFIAIALDYSLSMYIFEKTYGMPINTKLVNLPDSTTIFIILMFFVWVISIFAFVYLFRYLAKKWFSVQIGDPVVELDTKTRESKTYVNGELVSVKKWDK